MITLKLLALLGALSQSLFPSALGPLPTVTPAWRPMPAAVHAIYLTSSTAHTPTRVAELTRLVQTTELNAMVINTKEPNGVRIDNALKQTVQTLKNQGVWMIARQVVFQDDDLAHRHPELALKRAGGSLWQDSGGRTWADPASRAVWQYNLDAARAAFALGFDEVNLDYIRFPTDGDVAAIRYPSWNGKTPREDVLAQFLRWFSTELKASYPHAIISVDVFGYTFLHDWDVGMGQRITKLAPALDVVAPMVYPSHYAPYNFGFANPADHPTEVVTQTLALGQPLFTHTPNTIVRPWLQDFNLGAVYSADMVKKEITAAENSGYTHGWMLWNPRNVYTAGALRPK